MERRLERNSSSCLENNLGACVEEGVEACVDQRMDHHPGRAPSSPRGASSRLGPQRQRRRGVKTSRSRRGHQPAAAVSPAAAAAAIHPAALSPSATAPAETTSATAAATPRDVPPAAVALTTDTPGAPPVPRVAKPYLTTSSSSPFHEYKPNTSV